MDNYLFLPKALSSALFDVSFAGTIGCLIAHIRLGAAVDDGRRSLSETLRRTLASGAAALLVLLAVQSWLLTAAMLGSSSFIKVRSQLIEVLTETHAGRRLIPAAVCLLALFVTASVRGVMARSFGAKLTLLFAVAFVGVRSASGHAGSQGELSLAVAVQFLHLSSIAIWSGGVMVGGLIVVPGLLRSQQPVTLRMVELEDFARVLSRTSFWAVSVVGASGLYNAWAGLGGSPMPLENTQWGILLTVKSGLVFIAVAIGARNRRILRRNGPLQKSDAILLARWIRAEALVMVAILALSGFLANSPPANS